MAKLPGTSSGGARGRDAGELTIDELAAAVKMTVRNVRAYAGRGLIPAPRLVGRTGYYSKEHVDRLLLIRDLLDRGYTLSAVEEALTKRSSLHPSHALDLLGALTDPRAPEEPERISLEDLAREAGVESDAAFIDQLVGYGLARRVSDDELLLIQPGIVRAGVQAVGLGLSRESVLALLPFIAERMSSIAERFVEEVRSQVWEPFTEAGFPEEEWPQMLGVVETLLPVAGQAVVAVFRQELNKAIDAVLGAEIDRLAT